MAETATETYRADYSAKGYCLIRSLLSPETAARTLSDIADDINRAGIDKFLGKTSIHSLPGVEIYSHQYKLLNALQWGVTPLIRDIVGGNLVPSFAYFQVYQKNNKLFVHYDRPSCEHSLSLTLAYSDNVPWDLTVSKELVDHSVAEQDEEASERHTEAGYHRIPMAPGDGVLYPGRMRRHGRLEPNPNRWSAHIFMHWVDADGPNAGLAFDGKKRETKVDFNIPRV
jgi:hypothetical protein